MPILVLVRGLPHSGKTTYANDNFAAIGFKHLESDMFFTKGGVYKYVPGQNPKAINWCQRETLKAMKLGEDIVVSNVFAKHWEMGFYLDNARKLGYTVIVHRCYAYFGPSPKIPIQLFNYNSEVFEP